jgi:adenine-specific DNA-methyltransferase
MNRLEDIELTEQLRKLKQDEVDLSKPKLERNKLGQFSTPRDLADELLLYIKGLNIFDEVNFFDPAFGMGSFYTALVKVFGAKVNALGFELDSDYYSAAKEVWSEYTQLTVKNIDFTKENPDDYKKANLIVCNPPYIRHQHLSREIKDRLKKAIEESGNSLSGLAGLHAYFMLLCDQWLEEEGLAVWLVPSEILEVNYGKSIRNYLSNNVKLERIHFFDHTDAQFNDALVSSCVIVYRKEIPAKDYNVDITFGRSFLKPTDTRTISSANLKDHNKWSKHLLTHLETLDKPSSQNSKRKLGDVFSIKRGIATGDNNFFVLDKQKALDLGIPKEYLRNVIPSSRYLKGDVVGLDRDGFLNTEKKLVLLDIDLPLKQIQTEYPKLYNYLLEGMNRGVDKGYLASRRKPWYSQEKRLVPKYFVRYMNRESKSGGTHHSIFIKNEADAIATNSYLMIYEKPTDLFVSLPSETDMWTLLSRGLDKTLYKYGRTYGGGLVKFEPNELKEIPI